MKNDRRRWLAYEIRRLSSGGSSQREIAQALRIARRTVKSIITEVQQQRADGETALDRDLPHRVPKASKLDAHEGDIRKWIDETPLITAKECRTRLKNKGLEVGHTIVRDLVKALKEETKPKRPAEVVHYVPGKRAEFDWSPYTLASGLKINVWNTTLSWSHASYAVACMRARQNDVLTNLRESFEAWGGVPHECITDSMPGVVDRWECDQPRLNIKFVDFAVHYDFAALVAPRRTPTAKPHTEGYFRYHEISFFNCRKIHTFEDYQAQLAEWNRDTAMHRPHPESGLAVAEMLAQERQHLKPLPRVAYDTRDVVIRLVSETGYAHYMSNEYPAAAPVGSLVYLCAGKERVQICDAMARRLIEHDRRPDGAGIRLPQLAEAKRPGRYDLDDLVERVGEWSEVAREFAIGLRKAQRFAGPALLRLLNLQLDWLLDDIVASMRHAMEYHRYETQAVERILAAHHRRRPFEAQLAASTRRHVKTIMESHPISARPHSNYESFRTSAQPLSSPPSLEKPDDKEEECSDQQP